MLPRNLLTTLLLVASVLSSWWLYRQALPPETGEPVLSTHEPDYSFENFVMTAMNTDGRPQHRLSGTRMAHFPDDDTTELDNPELYIYVESAPRWRINADHGLVSSDGEEVLLSGEVEIERQPSPESDAVLTLTRDVTIRPDEEYAETDQPVTITSADGAMEVNAVGMRAWIAEGRLELLSDVRGRYVPAR